MNQMEDIIRLVKEEDVEFIRLQFTDMFGTLKNVAVTARQLEHMPDKRYLFDGSCMYGPVRTGEEDMFLYPDLDTFVILPWRPQQGKVARLICDVYKTDGKPLAVSPREILKRTLQKIEKEGYEFRVDPECEFFLFHTDDNGIPTTMTHEQAGYMDISPLDLGENARRDMVLTLEEMGFDIESSHHAAASAQHTIYFKNTRPMQTADNIMTFRTAVRSIAKRFGLHATFMPKPRTDIPGSGMHLNFSLYRNGKNVFADPTLENGLSREAKWFLGGIMDHALAMCAITNPLVNSYKRIVSGDEAPKAVDWTIGAGNTLLRVPFVNGQDTRIELRLPDSSANPYLTLALCMEAGIHGILQKAEPATENTPLKVSYGVFHLPETLKQAVIYMEGSELVRETLGEEFMQRYVPAKYQEWEEYLSQVSEWEVEKYLYRT